MSDFTPRQILIVDESMWEAMRQFARHHGINLDRIPDGADERGVPFFREQKPETECPRCGHVPTYAFMPRR